MAGSRTTGKKVEYPPLLSQGFHTLSREELKKIVVDKFPQSQRRDLLWNNFIMIADQLENLGVPCDIWIDGSFLTEKQDPDDVDFILDVPVDFLLSLNKDQKKLLNDLSNRVYKHSHNLHSFIMFNAPVPHKSHPSAVQLHNRWEKDFGFSRDGKVPKGIAILEVTP